MNLLCLIKLPRLPLTSSVTLSLTLNSSWLQNLVSLCLVVRVGGNIYQVVYTVPNGVVDISSVIIKYLVIALAAYLCWGSSVIE